MACFNAKIIKKLFWLLPGPVFYVLFRLSFLCPQFIESVYSRGFFMHFNSMLSSAVGILPFSLAEFVLYAFILSASVYTVFIVVHAIMARRTWWRIVLRRIWFMLCVASLLYALFVSLWGFNYARLPLNQTLNLDSSAAACSELYHTCDALISRANSLRETVPQNSRGVFSPAETKTQIMHSVNGYYNQAASAAEIEFLGGNFGNVKPVLYSEGLSWANISGVYFPYTGEANVNVDAPMALFAASCLHEAAHQRGFAREDEANFLAFYVSRFSGEPSVEYSGTLLALIHAMSALFDADKELYFELRANYSGSVERDLVDRALFWNNYQGGVSEAAKEVNNSFLKANMQHDGVQSYGRVVDLLIALWRKGEL